MPSLYLHTGLPKTGTTSVQKTLHQNAKALARQGILYPITGQTGKHASWGQHELAYALRNEASGRALWRELRREADSAGLPKVVVSSEELSLLPFPTLPALRPYQLIREVFDDYEIVLICYLRPQADMAASLYNHNVKSVGETANAVDFLARIAPRLDYMQYLHVAGAALGHKAIRVRRYGPDWLRGDIVEDLAHEIGLDLSHDIKRLRTTLNPGMTSEGLLAMLEANRRLADDPGKLKRERVRLLARHRAAPFQSSDMLGDEVRRTIAALYRYKNTQIGRRFLQLDGDLFDPATQPLPRPAGSGPNPAKSASGESG